MIVYDKEQKQIVIPNGLGNVNIIINGGECPEPNLGDLVKEITENGNYVYYASNDGLDGYNMADIRINVPQEGSGCKLITRTIKENGTYRASDGYSIPVINFSQNGAFDSKLKVDVINTYIEFYFAFKDERPGLMSFYGCEDADWNDSTFAARYYEGNINVKIGTFERSFNVNEYGLVDGNAHKMKVGRTYGIEIDGQMVATSIEIEDGIVFTPSETRTIYIGAINSPGIEDNGLNLFWRPFNGFIGPVTIYGKRENGEEVTYNYEPGDFGRWGEYKVLQTGEILKNINTQEGATPLDHKAYNTNADGYSEVTVNVPQYNLGTLDWTLTSPSTEVKNASDDGYDGYSQVTIRPENIIAQEKESAINDFKNKMKEITITENGTYSIEDKRYVESLRYNGGYHTDTISTYDINRIEVTFKADTSESINGGTYPFILGGSLWGLSELPENSGNNACARAIQYGYGRIVGYWEGKHTGASGTMDGEWLTIVLDENGMTIKYPTYEEHSDYVYDNGNVNGGGDIFPFIIGGQGKRGGADESGNRTSSLIENSQFRGLIKEIKINTNSMGEITYIPKDLGVWDRKVENTGEFLSALEPTEGEVTMNNEAESKYPNGFKRVEVNVPDLNGSYDEGYNQGKIDGANEQKSKLESISITGNGVYSKEDGYNHIEVNVVPQMDIEEFGLNVWYNDLKRITDENEKINSDWGLAMMRQTILQNVFPGISMTISGQAVAKPFFIREVDRNNNALKIGKLVSNAYGTPVSCAVVIIGAFDCKNIQTVDLEAFKYMTDLCFIDGMNGLGESFTSPQTIDFTYCTNLFIKTNSRQFISNFAESLFNLSAGNKNSINTSTLKFKSAVQERGENADAIALMRSKGWTVEFV